MNLLVWLENTLRKIARTNLIGRLILQIAPTPRLNTIHLISATRLTERKFWRQSALGQSLKPWLDDPRLRVSVQFDNTEGFPSIYNRALIDHSFGDAIVFVHDDVWIDDPEWIDKVFASLNRFDIVGAIGLIHSTLTAPVLAGAVAHGHLRKGTLQVYGSAISPCTLLHGIFIAVRSSHIRRSKILFNEELKFRGHDLDFCRRARRIGLELGTWPILLTHQGAKANWLNFDSSKLNV